MTPSSVDSFHTAHSMADDEELSDSEIDALLARASQRLKEQTQDKQLTTQSEEQRLTFLKLDAGELEKPYVDTSGNIAKLNDDRLLEDKHRNCPWPFTCCGNEVLSLIQSGLDGLDGI